MTDNYRRTLCDIDIIINELNENEKNKVPKKLREFIHNNKLENYTSSIKVDIPLEDQKLHPDTQGFLAMLYLNYWCKDDEEKKELRQILKDNEAKHQKELSEKYDVYKIFEKRQKEANENLVETKTQMVVYKESIIKKILRKIFNLFRRKKNGKI